MFSLNKCSNYKWTIWWLISLMNWFNMLFQNFVRRGVVTNWLFVWFISPKNWIHVLFHVSFREGAHGRYHSLSIFMGFFLLMNGFNMVYISTFELLNTVCTLISYWVESGWLEACCNPTLAMLCCACTTTQAQLHSLCSSTMNVWDQDQLTMESAVTFIPLRDLSQI